MKNWTIGKRITFGFAGILAILAVMAVSSFMLLSRIKAHQQEILTDALPGVGAAGQIKYLACEIQLGVLRTITAKTEEERKTFESDIKAATDQTQKAFDDYEKTISRADDREQFNQLATVHDAYSKSCEPLLASVRAGNVAEAQQLLPAVRLAYTAYLKGCDGLFEANMKFGNTAGTASQKSMFLANTLTIVLAIAGILLGMIFSFILIRGINRVLISISGALDDGSNQVVSASSQVSSSSQTLAEGSSEQAASLEETSSSLEEMASMTKRNSENAQKANELAKQTRAAADKGATDMQSMSSAMEAIKASSDDIAKIIKTIDEIAFQTNILALNAAVEAARAGEAGMGFAVVADEVRNLAQRSAQAAKETAGKIEGAITKTGQGVEISGKVAQALNDIAAKVRQVDELVAEVAGASQEQTQGITQINTAVGQMDKVTQSNAASAEESAAAAEELNAQAETMKQSVIELLKLVGTATQTSTAKSHIATGHTKEARPSVSAGKRSGSVSGNGHSHAAPAMATAGKGREQIPLEGDFKDF